MKMQQVSRAGVFETNSSSTHSISIVGSTGSPDVFPCNGDVCEVHPGDFGWDEESFYSATVKASYCLTFLMTRCFDDQQDKYSSMLKNVLKKETGKKVEFVSTSSKYNPWGYIDHQSNDVCLDAFHSKKTLRNFIFNPKSWLKTDNDNH